MKIGLVQNLFLFMAIMLCAQSAASEKISKECVSEDDLALFFDSVAYTGTNIVFRFKKSGSRFAYLANGQCECKVSEYGETISWDCSSELKFFNRHFTLTLSPLNGRAVDMGFKLSLRKDFRSMGKDLSMKYAHLTVDESKENLLHNGAENATKRLLGLKICPLEGDWRSRRDD